MVMTHGRGIFPDRLIGRGMATMNTGRDARRRRMQTLSGIISAPSNRWPRHPHARRPTARCSVCCAGAGGGGRDLQPVAGREAERRNAGGGAVATIRNGSFRPDRTGRTGAFLSGIAGKFALQNAARRMRSGDAVIITPSSDNIIRTHKHRLGNKRELAFGATIGDGQLNQLCLRVSHANCKNSRVHDPR